MKHAGWAVTDFHDALCECLDSVKAQELRLYFYGVTTMGWAQVSKRIAAWKKKGKSRTVTAYIGTDHGLTEAAALEAMLKSPVSVRLLMHYDGIYHPKVVWFCGKGSHTILAGSNNLTFSGLKQNIEFATITQMNAVNDQMNQWHRRIHHASEPLTNELIANYKKDRESHFSPAAKAGFGGVYTWKMKDGAIGLPDDPPKAPKKKVKKKVVKKKPAKKKPATRPKASLPPMKKGDLVLEITPRETSYGGSQVQIPLAAAKSFFGLPNRRGATVSFRLKHKASGGSRNVTMTYYNNDTTRISFSELDYSDRPCVMLFSKLANGRFEYTLYRESIYPAQYRGLIGLCSQSRPRRRWKLI